MENDNHIAGLANYLGPQHTDKNGNLHFKARVIYKWTDKMQQDIADVAVTQENGHIATVAISNAPYLSEDNFILHFSSGEQTFKHDADNTILIINGKDSKLHGKYSVEIIPAHTT